MSRRGWVLFSAMCLIWGVPYLMIKVAVEELEPATLVLLRCGLATLLLLPLAASNGQVRPLFAHWRALLAFSLVEICVPWVLLGYAELRLSSSLTGLLIATVPLVGALLARFTGARERLGALRALGLLLGLVGVLALVGFELGSGDVPAILALAGVAVGYAIGPIILARSLADQPGIGVMALSLAIATVLYLPVGIAQAPHHWPSTDVILSVVGLAALCTALAFVLFFALIGEVGPARATVVAYVNPAVAVLLGVLVLDERFTLSIALGFVLVLVGSILATGASRRRRGAPEPEEVFEDATAVP